MQLPKPEKNTWLNTKHRLDEIQVAVSYQQYLDQAEACAALSSASLPMTDP